MSKPWAFRVREELEEHRSVLQETLLLIRKIKSISDSLFFVCDWIWRWYVSGIKIYQSRQNGHESFLFGMFFSHISIFICNIWMSSAASAVLEFFYLLPIFKQCEILLQFLFFGRSLISLLDGRIGVISDTSSNTDSSI